MTVKPDPALPRSTGEVYLALTLETLAELTNILVVNTTTHLSGNVITLVIGDNRGRVDMCPKDENR